VSGKVAYSVSGLLKDATKVKVPFTPPTTNSINTTRKAASDNEDILYVERRKFRVEKGGRVGRLTILGSAAVCTGNGFV